LNLRQGAGSFKKIFFFAMLCALFIPFNIARGVYAQAQANVTITAQAGLDGFCKVDQWLPVHVTVENSGADINARVQASYKNSASGQTVNGMYISLPSTSRKEFFLYVMPEGLMRTLNVSVLNGNKTLAKTNLNINCTSDPTTLIGVLADNPSTYGILNNARPLAGVAKTAQLNIADLPDLAQGWNMLDALVISNVDTGTLTPEQKQALELWLANGGKLFVTGGIQWQSTTAGLNNLLPIQVTSTQNVSGLSALAAYAMASNSLEGKTILATGAVQTEANILIEQDGIPLLIEKEIGFGKVYFFAADPSLEPLNNSGEMQAIYEHLLAVQSPKPSWATGAWDTYYSSSALSALPELSLPSFFYICCWLGLYIVIIAPVNYFILRRMKRTELAWVTVPVLVIIFTSLAYFSGTIYRGTRPILNRIVLMQAWQGVDKASSTAIVGLYSPTRSSYNVESQEQFLIYPYPSINGDLQGNNNWLSLKKETGASLPDVRVEIGGMQSLGMEGYLPSLSIQHDLILSLSEKTPILKGSITNTSAYTLKKAAIFTPSGWETLGDLKPNESKDVNIPLINNSNTSGGNLYSILTAFGWDALTPTDSIEERRHAAFFQSVNAAANSNAINVNSGVYLMAWMDNGMPVPVSLQAKESSATDTTFYIEKLTPALQTKAGRLQLTSSIYSWESSLGDTLTTSYYNLPSDGYNLRFQPSLPIHFSKVDSLTLNIGTNVTPYKIKTSLWNTQTKTWTPIALNFGDTNIPEAWQYVGMDGEILIKINGDPNDSFEITSVDFILMVQP